MYCINATKINVNCAVFRQICGVWTNVRTSRTRSQGCR